ncbi:MAG: hypothetical protein PSV13_14930 [Lacunisphaera sp.]|nr:hypothetical protein [Lacunisphaera sp.]
MLPLGRIFRRRYLLATALAGLHTALIIFILLASLGPQGERSGYVWLLPYLIDYPASQLGRAFAIPPRGAPIFFLILGIVYWGLIGFLIQTVWNRYAKSRAPKDKSDAEI